MRMHDVVSSLQEYYAELDKVILGFQQKSGLHCLAGCGACCRNPNVETTVLELLPMAFHLWQNGLAPAIMELLGTTRPFSCILYQPEEGNPDKGKCGAYPFRPLICRLFGYAISKDKTGEARLSTCKRIKEAFPDTVRYAESLIENGEELPVFSECWLRLVGEYPELAVNRLPINRALMQALDKVGLYLSIMDQAGVSG